MDSFTNISESPVFLHGAEHLRMRSHCSQLWALASALGRDSREPIDTTLLSELIFYFGGEAKLHHELEEAVDFPKLLALPLSAAEREQLQSLVDALTVDHRELARQWDVVHRDLTSAAEGKRAANDMRDIATFITLYQHHVHREELGILPITHSHHVVMNPESTGTDHAHRSSALH